MADPCADGARLPGYWCSFYSPCLSLFFPVFAAGQQPEVLAVGDRAPAEDSPWWRCHRLVHLARADAPERGEATRAHWAQDQEELLQSTHALAVKARALIDAGDGALADEKLSS